MNFAGVVFVVSGSQDSRPVFGTLHYSILHRGAITQERDLAHRRASSQWTKKETVSRRASG